ncbi:hypothetical protein Q9R08_10400 [Microbacterium sp. QXD-8]|uniref:Uncharacterized protein n=1 Tax=Microbacterium psychrotolerans TaxID=3068321 RepID=A0ABU0Z3K8_9MICO|nr:hypothetical protein [Microbacterium sp. QXD-8]MDQ7878384.1 hypothetical protein [Microbacterium sp. QXD-8]
MGLRGKTGAPQGGPPRPRDEHDDDLEAEREREAALAGLFGPLLVGERQQPTAVAAASARIMAHHGAAAASVPATAPTVAALLSVPPARVTVPAPAAAVPASPEAPIPRPTKPAPPIPSTVVAANLPAGSAAATAELAEAGDDSLATGGPAASAPGSGDSPRALAATVAEGAPTPVGHQVLPPRTAPLEVALLVEAQRPASPNTAETAPRTSRPARRSAAARWGLVAASVIVVGALVTTGTVTVQSAMARDRLAAAVAQLDEAAAGVVAAQADLDAAIVEDAALGADSDAAVAAAEPVLAQLAGISDDAALQEAQVAVDELIAAAGAAPVTRPDAGTRTTVDTADVEAVAAATHDADGVRADLVAAASDVRTASAALEARIEALRAAVLALGASLPASADRIAAENPLPAAELRDAVLTAAAAAAAARENADALAAMGSYAGAVAALRGEQDRIAAEQQRLHELEQQRAAQRPRSQQSPEQTSDPAPAPDQGSAPQTPSAPSPQPPPQPEPGPQPGPDPQPDPDPDPEPQPDPGPRDGWPWGPWPPWQG